MSISTSIVDNLPILADPQSHVLVQARMLDESSFNPQYSKRKRTDPKRESESSCSSISDPACIPAAKKMRKDDSQRSSENDIEPLYVKENRVTGNHYGNLNHTYNFIAPSTAGMKFERTNMRSILTSLPPPMERCIAEQCFECGSHDVIEDWQNGHDVCRSCGLVLNDRIVDVESEWRTFADDDSGQNRSRVHNVGNPLYEVDFLTSVGSAGLAKHTVAPRPRHKMLKYSIFDNLLIEAISKIEKLGERLKIHGAVLNRAKEIFKAYLVLSDPAGPGQNDIGKSRPSKPASIIETVAGSVFIACRAESIPRTLKELSVASQLTRKAVATAVRRITSVLPDDVTKRCVTAKDYVYHFSNLLNLPSNMNQAAVDLANKLTKSPDVLSRSPTTVAATAVYIIGTLSGPEYALQMFQLPDVTGVAKVTILKTLKSIIHDLKNLLPSSYANCNAIGKLIKN